MRDSSFLRGHRAFCRLSVRAVDELARGVTFLSCPADKTLLLEGSPVEGLYLIKEGVCRQGETLYTAGDILCEKALTLPTLVEKSVTTLEECRVLYLTGDYFLRWSERFPRQAKKLNFASQKSPDKPAFRTQTILREYRLFWFIKSLPFLLLPPLFLIRVFFRQQNGTFVQGHTLICRYFRLRSFKNTNLTIPLEQIQSIEVVQKGIVSRLLKTGNLLVRINGNRGNILIQNIPHPVEEQKRILGLKRQKAEVEQAKKHEKIRQDIAQWAQKESGLRILERGDQLDEKKEYDCVFRKSYFVLIRNCWWQIILSAGCVVLYYWAREQDKTWAQLPLVSLLLVLCLFLYTFVDWINDLYKVEGGYILDINRQPLGKRVSRKQAELSSIQNVIAEQKGFWSNLCNFGDVRIIVPGAGEGIFLEGVDNPRGVQERVLGERKNWIESVNEKERRQQQEDLKLYCRLISQELSEKYRS